MTQASSIRHPSEDKFSRFKDLFDQHMTRLSLHHEEPTEPVYDISYDRTNLQAQADVRVKNSPLIQLPPIPVSATTETIPLVIVQLLCDHVRDELRMLEGLMGFPMPVMTATRRTRNDVVWQLRSILRNVSLVRRDWTRLAQAVLRSRIQINSAHALQKFSRSSFCGKWVQELRYRIEIRGPESQKEVRSKNELDIFRDIVKLAPNLRALSISSQSIHTESLFASLSLAPSTLQALHVQLKIWNQGDFDQLCTIVASLHHLETLSIIGGTFNVSRADTDSSFQRLGDNVLRGSPPASLKRLLLEFDRITCEAIALRYFAWFFLPRDDYQLHELRLRQNIWDVPPTVPSSRVTDQIQALLPILSPMLRDLKVLEVRLSQYLGRAKIMSVCPGSIQSLIEKCTTLEKLHANLINKPSLKLFLPKTLQHLYFFTSFNALRSAVYDDEELAELLAPLLTQGSLPNLRSVNVSDFAHNNEGWHLFTTRELCKGAGVKYFSPNDGAVCTWERDMDVKYRV